MYTIDEHTEFSLTKDVPYWTTNKTVITCKCCGVWSKDGKVLGGMFFCSECVDKIRRDLL